jgi:hypothetical protein
MKTFKGRVLAEGTYKGEAAVSHQGFNTLASFQKSALSKHCKSGHCLRSGQQGSLQKEHHG